jgi:hypothetical protein
MRNDKTIYKLTVADLQEVADFYLERELTEIEIEQLIEETSTHINWYDAINLAMIKLNIK